jgi:hypothetical protein
VFDKLVEALVFGCGYERLGDGTCSATTLRRRRDEWIRLGLFDRLRLAVLDAYERMIGLDLADVCVDGCITKAPAAGSAPGAAGSTGARAACGARSSPMAPGFRWPPSQRRPTPVTTACCRPR